MRKAALGKICNPSSGVYQRQVNPRSVQASQSGHIGELWIQWEASVPKNTVDGNLFPVTYTESISL